MSALTAAEVALLSRAAELAGRAAGKTSPNPLVGAVVARGGRIVGEGWHEGPGLAHAEVMALRAAGDQAQGATVACTLEPCSHHGRTPPCVDALVAAGVRRVVIGVLDPLERSRAQGVAVLRQAGIEVAVAEGSAADGCREVNAAFLTWAATGRPLVTLKLATSLDGKIATATGESKWITGAPARERVHRWRAESDAVMVGIGTALADNPTLTARDTPVVHRQPTRVVVDSQARLPLDCALVRGARDAPVILFVADGADVGRVSALAAAGLTVLAAGPGPRVDLAQALKLLGQRDVLSVLVEGGAELAAGLVEGGLVDRIAWFLAPKIIGGQAAPSAIGGSGPALLADACKVACMRVETIGDDILVTGGLR